MLTSEARRTVKNKLRRREHVFAGWMSFPQPGIAELFCNMKIDLLVIDMEHTSISLEQSQQIITASQAAGVACLPRPVSHLNDWTKPLLDIGSDGMVFPMVQNAEQVSSLVKHTKYAPIGQRSFGVNRAHQYGLNFSKYTSEWNDSSLLILQIESIEAAQNIESILDNSEIDAVMVGPYDMSGSAGVPGQTDHPSVINAAKNVISACEKFNISCGTQIASPSKKSIHTALEQGYNLIFLGSDLFALWDWVSATGKIIDEA